MFSHPYTINCASSEIIFQVKLESSATVDKLRLVIAEKMLRGRESAFFTLYQVDIRGSPKEIRDAIKKRIPELEKEESLYPFLELSDVFSSPLAEGGVHIIAVPPPSE
jgi:hypothetical protein